mgnify:FL=1
MMYKIKILFVLALLLMPGIASAITVKQQNVINLLYEYDVNDNGYIDTNELLSAADDCYQDHTLDTKSVDFLAYVWQNDLYFGTK